MWSQCSNEPLHERISSQASAPSTPEGGGAAAVSTSDRATISRASCSRWMLMTCLVLPKQSVSLFMDESGVVEMSNSSSRCGGSSLGSRHSDMTQPRTGEE